MKLRIKGNSIRLRLGQSEVRRLSLEGMVEESTVFGPAAGERFGYVLRAGFDDIGVTASFSDCRLVVSLPIAVVDRWAASDQVGIEARQPIADGELRILIEKDFQCIDAPAEEPQDDAFPNPQLRACDVAQQRVSEGFLG